MADSFELNDFTPSQLMLYQKQQEHAGLQALKAASAQLLERVEKLGEMSNVMADGGEAIGQVMRNWPHVFSVLNLFDRPTPGDTSSRVPDEPEEPLPQLVRLPYSGENNAAVPAGTTTTSTTTSSR